MQVGFGVQMEKRSLEQLEHCLKEKRSLEQLEHCFGAGH